MSGTFARWAGDTPLDGRGRRGRPALVPVTGVVDATSRLTASADDRRTLALVNDSALGLSAAVFTGER